MSVDTLVLGASELLGRQVMGVWGVRAFGTYYKRPVATLSRFDAAADRISDLLAEGSAVTRCILLLGDTHIDRCAMDPERSEALNVSAICRIIDELACRSIMPIFVSTDVVFDGKAGAYSEADTPAPILTYGKQKVAIERHLAATKAPYLIVRLAKIISSDPDHATVLSGWRSDLAEGRLIRCAEDLVQSPIDLEDAVTAIRLLVEGGKTGLYHVAGEDVLSRAELFDVFMANVREYRNISPRFERCSIRDFDFAEERPLNTSLDISRLIRETGFRPRSMRETSRAFARAVYSK